MMNTNLPEAAALLDLPDGVIVEHGITVISYLDENGRQNYGWTIHGDPLTSTTLGLLVIVEHTLALALSRDAD